MRCRLLSKPHNSWWVALALACVPPHCDCVRTWVRQMKAARLLDIPVVVTEQYPRALKHTGTALVRRRRVRSRMSYVASALVEELQAEMRGDDGDASAASVGAGAGSGVDGKVTKATSIKVHEKLLFSMLTPEVRAALPSDRNTAVVFGIEVLPVSLRRDGGCTELLTRQCTPRHMFASSKRL